MIEPPSRQLSEVLGPALVVALWVAYSPSLYHPFFGVRAALLLIGVGPLLVLLVQHARHDQGGRAGLLLCLVAAVAAATSPLPMAALWGEANWGNGVLFVVCLVGLWAWGRTFTPTARMRVRVAMVLGLGINVAVAVLQQLDAVPPSLSMVDRPFGLTGNAVHLGALAAATLVLAVPAIGTLDLVGATACVLAGAGVQLAGGRSALGLLVVGVLLVARRARSVRVAVVALALTGASVLGAGLVPGAAPSATQRTAAGESSGSFRPRLEAWREAADAFADRPLLGAGPGRFRAATSPHRTLQAARLEGDSRFVDAHNFMIETAVTTGILGALALGAWLAVVARRSRGPWAGVAFLLLLAQLVEPMSVAITPIAALAAGLGSPPPSGDPVTGRRWTLARGVTTALGAVLASVLLIGEVSLQQGSLNFDRAALVRAESLLPHTWPTAPLVRVRVEGFYGAQDRDARRLAVLAARRAVAADPSDDASWSRLGQLEGVWGSQRRAATAYAEALQRNPWSVDALRGGAQAALAADDAGQVAELCSRLRKVTVKGRCGDRPMAAW
jgi:O-antigen ligase